MEIVLLRCKKALFIEHIFSQLLLCVVRRTRTLYRAIGYNIECYNLLHSWLTEAISEVDERPYRARVLLSPSGSRGAFLLCQKSVLQSVGASSEALL